MTEKKFGNIEEFEENLEQDTGELYEILGEAVKINASDIHLISGEHPVLRQDGVLITYKNFEKLTDEKLANYLKTITNKEQQESFEETLNLDFSIPFETERFRVHVFRQKGKISCAFRLIPSKMPTIDQLGLPDILYDFTRARNGLILVVGVTGSGKSTTLASMVNEINETQRKHIITIEDPIEFVHTNKLSIVQQRELGIDVRSFGDATRAALREDPDIVLVGELRDKETVQNALTLAETGHLVFGTLHTKSVADTVDRIVDIFPPEQQQQIRVQFANVMEGIIAQELMEKVGGGRVAIFEIIKNMPAVATLINMKSASAAYTDNMESNEKALGTKTRVLSIYHEYLNGNLSIDTIKINTTPEEQRVLQGYINVNR